MSHHDIIIHTININYRTINDVAVPNKLQFPAATLCETYVKDVTYVKIRDARSLFVCWTVMAACRGSSSKWFFTREQLETTPSRRCGVEPDRELSYRQQAANLIQDMGQRLNVYPSYALFNSRPIRLSRCDCLFYVHTCNICHFSLSWIYVIVVTSAEIIRCCQFILVMLAARAYVLRRLVLINVLQMTDVQFVYLHVD